MLDVELYPYQETAVAGVFGEFDAGRAGALVVMPTGTGKTIAGVAVIARVVAVGGRALVLAHRGELLTQWAEACDLFGLNWAVEKAAQRGLQDSLYGRADVVLGSVATLRGKRLLDWPERHFDLIIVDEAHHGTATTYLQILSHFSRAKRLGLTATPERGDGDEIQEVFGRCAFEYPLWQAIEEGWLVPPLFKRPPCSIDLSSIDGSGDDLNQGDLEDAISGNIEELVNGAKPEIGDRLCMAFTPKVASAQAMADGFRQVSIAARSVHGTSADRDVVVRQFKDREFQCLCSCAMLLEGYDNRFVSALVMARPTKSSIVFRQMLGRGLRTCAEIGKDHCLIVDYAWNSGRHDLFRPIDLFDTSGMDLAVLDIADKLMRDGKADDPRKAIQEAEEIHRRQVAMKVTVRERDPRYRMLAFDPFQVGSLLGIPKRHVAPGAKKLTTANAHRLASLKLDSAGITNAEAERLLKALDARRSAGKATHRMVAALVSNGVPAAVAADMSFEEAGGDLDIILGWSRKERVG